MARFKPIEARVVHESGAFTGQVVGHRRSYCLPSATLKDRLEVPWQEVAFRAWKTDRAEHRAIRIANESVGLRRTQRLSNALDGKLDEISDWARLQAVANARRLANMVINTTPNRD